MGNPKTESFGHSDSGKGSYEIWYRGNKIVIDGGIPEYGLSKRAKNFKSYNKAGQIRMSTNHFSGLTESRNENFESLKIDSPAPPKIWSLPAPP